MARKRIALSLLVVPLILFQACNGTYQGPIPGEGNNERMRVTLHVTSDPDGAHVTDAERGYLGRTPLTAEFEYDSFFEEGDKPDRVLTFELPGFATEHRSLKLNYNDDGYGTPTKVVQRFNVVLKPDSGAVADPSTDKESSLHRVHFTSEPTGASVYEGDKFLGCTPIVVTTVRRVASGSSGSSGKRGTGTEVGFEPYEVRFEMTGYRSRTITVQPTDTQIHAVLQPLKPAAR